jgi:hypothetical protein
MFERQPSLLSPLCASTTELRFHDCPQVGKGSPIPIQPSAFSAAWRVRKPQVPTVWRNDALSRQRRNHQAFVAKSDAIAIPRHHSDPHIRGRTKARQVDVDSVVRVALIDADRLDLDSEHPSGLLVQGGHLRSLEVRKWPEQSELIAVGQASDDLCLATETN